jgi:L-2-hydroxyglutarate oxidase LhgO
MQVARVAVIGAGVVGLACAATLARRGHSVYVLERHGQIGTEISSRNSEVIHAGLYYPSGSRKARACVEGRRLLLAWAERHAVPFRLTGKLVVATSDDQLEPLQALLARGLANGSEGLCLLEAPDVKRREPHVRALAGLWSPGTGVLDSHAFMLSLRGAAHDRGALFALHTEVDGIDSHGAGLTLHTRDARGERFALEVDWAVNAAGLSADRVAALSGVEVDRRALRQFPCKGDYFALASRFTGLVRHLVYPMPEAAGLGVHLTMDLSGALRAGPDTAYVDSPRYDVDESKAAAFARAVQRYLPLVREDDLRADYAGVRPKLQGPRDPFRDFVCDVYPEAPRVVQLVGIESPGLTASLALAEEVAQHVRDA